MTSIFIRCNKNQQRNADNPYKSRAYRIQLKIFIVKDFGRCAIILISSDVQKMTHSVRPIDAIKLTFSNR